MKWILLFLVTTYEPAGTEIVERLEFDSNALCEKAKQVMSNFNEGQVNKMVKESKIPPSLKATPPSLEPLVCLQTSN